MDEFEFERLLHLFPVVRPRDYYADSAPTRRPTSPSAPLTQSASQSSPPRQGTSHSMPPTQSTSHLASKEAREWQDAWDAGNTKEAEIHGINKFDSFWEKIRMAAERKVGSTEAERFCKAFRRIHKKLVYEELSLDTIRSLVNSSSSG